jgi:antitoxin component of MazEF toxin-antitoxin module
MLVRKIQSYGKDSLGITLPKQYLRALGIDKKDSVEIRILSDGSLGIVPLKSNSKGAGVDTTETPAPSSDPSRPSKPGEDPT